jgi:hypothetical protein
MRVKIELLEDETDLGTKQVQVSLFQHRSIPSTVKRPSLIGSSWLIVLIRVDFPEPEGPQTTTTSPC